MQHGRIDGDIGTTFNHHRDNPKSLHPNHQPMMNTSHSSQQDPQSRHAADGSRSNQLSQKEAKDALYLELGSILQDPQLLGRNFNGTETRAKFRKDTDHLRKKPEYGTIFQGMEPSDIDEYLRKVAAQYRKNSRNRGRHKGSQNVASTGGLPPSHSTSSAKDTCSPTVIQIWPPGCGMCLGGDTDTKSLLEDDNLGSEQPTGLLAGKENTDKTALNDTLTQLLEIIRSVTCSNKAPISIVYIGQEPQQLRHITPALINPTTIPGQPNHFSAPPLQPEMSTQRLQSNLLSQTSHTNIDTLRSCSPNPPVDTGKPKKRTRGATAKTAQAAKRHRRF